MEITIPLDSNIQNIVRKEKVIWRLKEKGYFKTFVISLPIGIGLIVFDRSAGHSFKTFSNSNTYTYDLHIAFSIGVSILIISFLVLVGMWKSKKEYHLKVDRFIQRNETDSCFLQVSDNAIKYISSELIYEIKWSALSHYRHYKNYLFILINNEPTSIFTVDERQISPEEFTQVLNLVKHKLVEKK